MDLILCIVCKFTVNNVWHGLLLANGMEIASKPSPNHAFSTCPEGQVVFFDTCEKVGTVFLDKVIFNKTKIPTLTAVLDVTQLRQRVIANNIANVSTQGYRRQDLRFQEYLDSFVRKSPVEGQRTDARHMAVPSPTFSPEVFEPETGLNDTGLNNVDVDMEMADLAENHLFFNVGTRLLSGGFDGLKKAISGRTA